MRKLIRHILYWIRRNRDSSDLAEEMEFHRSLRQQDLERSGLSRDDAAAASRRTMGNTQLALEDARRVWTGRWLEQTVQDLNYAARSISRTPSFTFAAVVVLALGIGLTTAIFSVVHGVLLRPLPFNEPDRLVTLHTVGSANGQNDNALSPPNFMSLQEEAGRVFANLTGWVEFEGALTGGGEAQRVEFARVGAGFFDALQVQPLLGRTFHPEENEPDREPVAVLSHALWRQQFGGDPEVMGRTFRLGEIAYTVVGVMPPGFDFPGGKALWTTLSYGRNYFSAASVEGRRGNAYVRVLGRLHPEVGLESGRTELEGLSRRFEARFPETNAGVRFTISPLHEELVGDVRTLLLLLFGAVGFVLVIATANVAGLLLARTASRREEIAVRTALGAGRGRMVRQLVTESLLLGFGGGALGLLLAVWATDELVQAHLEGLRRLGLAEAIQVDGMVLAFAFGVTILAGILAGLLPAFRGTDSRIAGSLQQSGRGGIAQVWRLRRALVVGQLALAMVLLHGAGLLLHSFVRLTSIDLGFQSEGILSFQVDLPPAVYGSHERVQAFFDEFWERLQPHPGVLSAGAINHLPIGSEGRLLSRFRIEGRAPTEETDLTIGARIISPAYFQTMGMTVLRGRGISAQDRTGGIPVVVINETAAAQFFPGEDPIGRRLADFGYDPIEDAAESFTVIGVVSDVRSRSLGDPPHAEAYFAHAQVYLPQMFVVVRTIGEPFAHSNALRSEIQALDSNIPIDFRTLDQIVAGSLTGRRSFATLLGLFSTVGLTLAVVGVFGLLSFAVAQRTREIGVRIALGASPGAMIRMIVSETLRLAVLGLGIGLAGALALAHALESQLFEVSPADPMTFAGAALALGAAALLAGLIPAWRAAAVDPLVALKSNLR